MIEQWQFSTSFGTNNIMSDTMNINSLDFAELEEYSYPTVFAVSAGYCSDDDFNIVIGWAISNLMIISKQ